MAEKSTVRPFRSDDPTLRRKPDEKSVRTAGAKELVVAHGEAPTKEPDRRDFSLCVDGDTIDGFVAIATEAFCPDDVEVRVELRHKGVRASASGLNGAPSKIHGTVDVPRQDQIARFVAR